MSHELPYPRLKQRGCSPENRRGGCARGRPCGKTPIPKNDMSAVGRLCSETSADDPSAFDAYLKTRADLVDLQTLYTHAIAFA
jgi:hypothetical protein